MENHQVSGNPGTLSRLGKAYTHPMSRMLLEAIALFGGLVVLKIVLIKPVLGVFGLGEIVFRACQGILTIIAMYSFYILLIRFFEKRSVNELAPRYLAAEGLIGSLAAALLVATVFAILWLTGTWYVVSVGTVSAMVVPAIWVFLLASLEELIFRGILYRTLEEWLGTVWALCLSATLFGGMHIFNDNADLLSVISAASGGLLMGALYTLTRRLWIPIFFHASWNFTQAVFGSQVSGSDMFGTYLVSVREGPEWLTGGAFGIENSVVTIGLVVLAFLAVLALARKRDMVVPSRKFTRFEQSSAFPPDD